MYIKVIQLYMYVCVYIYIYAFFQILFWCSLSQDIKYDFLCYIVGTCCLSVFYVVVCIC